MTRHRSRPVDPDTPVAIFIGKFCTSCAKQGIERQLTNHNRVQGSGNLTCKPCAAVAARHRHAIRAAQRADPNFVAPTRAKREPQPPADPIRSKLHSLMDRMLSRPSKQADEDFDSMLLDQRIKALIRFT